MMTILTKFCGKEKNTEEVIENNTFIDLLFSLIW